MLADDTDQACADMSPVLTTLQGTAVRGEGFQLSASSSRQVDPDLDAGLDPLDPRFLARIHDPHQK